MPKLTGAAADMVKNTDRMYSGMLWQENKSIESVEIYGKYKIRMESESNRKNRESSNIDDFPSYKRRRL